MTTTTLILIRDVQRLRGLCRYALRSLHDILFSLTFRKRRTASARAAHFAERIGTHLDAMAPRRTLWALHARGAPPRRAALRARLLERVARDAHSILAWLPRALEDVTSRELLDLVGPHVHQLIGRLEKALSSAGARSPRRVDRDESDRDNPGRPIQHAA